MPEETPRLGIKKFLGNETIKREKFNENYDIIDEKVALKEEVEEKLNNVNNDLQEHKNNTNNPHQTTYEQVGAAPFVHQHSGNDITSAVASAVNADTVDGKHANNQPNNLVVLNNDGCVPLNNLPLGHGGGLDADTVDGKHFEDIIGYTFERQGVCKSGEMIEVPDIDDYHVALIPIIDKYPQEYPYFSAPQNITISGGVQDTYQNTYVAIQGVSNNGKKGAYTKVVREGYYPRIDYPIIVTWSPIAGAASYNVYVSNGAQWRLYTNTTNTSCNITSYNGTIQEPTYDIADQYLRLEYIKTSNGFIPYLENYITTSQNTVSININKGVGETYQFQTPAESNSVVINMYMTWTLRWSGFSGSCTWGVRFRVRWKKYGEENWLGSRTYEHIETWGSQLIGGSKSYCQQATLNLVNLEQNIYVFEVYDIYEWLNNGNYWFNPHLRVYINNMLYQTAEKINEFHGIYLLFAKK